MSLRLFAACLALTTATPALADEQLNRALLGIGQLILNQNQQRQPPQVQPMPGQVAPRQGAGTQPQQRAKASAPSAQIRKVQHV